MPVDEFMQLALVHPEYGYYIKQNPLGAKGDFTTAPEISQVFGELIALWVVDKIVSLNTNQPIQIVELGAGRGTLMADILRVIQKLVPQIYDTLKVVIIETSPALIKIQQQALERHNVTHNSNLGDLPNLPTIFIGNEFFDALPIKQFLELDGQLKEQCIKVDNGHLSFSLDLSKGKIYEVCPLAQTIMQRVSKHIQAYGVGGLFIDYGYKQGSSDTLQAVKNHKYHDVLQDIGDADITAHVDFGALIDIADKHGLSANYSTQGEFLSRLGIDIRTQILCKNKPHQQQLEIQNATSRLISPNQMGELFKVLEVD